MSNGLNSPLSGSVKSRRGGSNTRRKVIFGAAAISVIPFLLSTYAASVTIGTGALELIFPLDPLFLDPGQIRATEIRGKSGATEIRGN